MFLTGQECKSSLGRILLTVGLFNAISRRTHLHKPRGVEGRTMLGRNTSEELLKKEDLIWVLPRAAPADPCPWIIPIMMSHPEQLSRSPFGLKGLMHWGGTYYRVQK